MARDPKRIDEVLNRLKRLWVTYPDLRLGQLIVNITYNLDDPNAANDLFYLEDDDFIAALEDYQKKVSGRV